MKLVGEAELAPDALAAGADAFVAEWGSRRRIARRDRAAGAVQLAACRQ
jgi:hypothetical protein